MENENSQPNMLENSYSDIEMKICSADPNTNQDSMTTMMTVIFVIDVLQQKPGTCHHHHFELGGGLPADIGVVHNLCCLKIGNCGPPPPPFFFFF